ncbi:zf-TFIIB domain-containing protein [Prochlorothrix hollandica]|uniref:zf-TFIIB domain-containing protein n=1 Tax=Prochlorothrix hollandica TaxID=1223 RepID=UPI003DA70671
MPVLCPKDRKHTLSESLLEDSLAVQCCPDCKGTWIPAENYETWQNQQPPAAPDPARLSQPLEVDFHQSPYDAKAALCPECSSYLARAKVNWSKPFFVERCPNCGGIWCDRGEWTILERLGLHRTIQVLFTQEWQAKVRHHETLEQERAATIDKLGPDIATQVFALAQLLEDHPNGDFGVAYLMRRFER